MIYQTFITQLRRQAGDMRRRIHIDWTGNGSDTIFQIPADNYPVLDQSATYSVKKATVEQTETTDYTLDKETGTLVMTTAPTNGQALTLDASAVYLTDASWLQIINDVIRSLGDDFFKEFVDETLTTTANMLSLSLVSAQVNCISVIDFLHRINTSENWQPVEEFTNWRYSRDANIIYLGDREAFTVAGRLFRVKGLKTYTIGTAIGDTIDVQDKFMTIVEYGCLARGWRYRYKNVVELISKMSQEPSRTPLQELIMLSDRFDRLYEAEKLKLKPAKPARLIPVYKEGGGRP